MPILIDPRPGHVETLLEATENQTRTEIPVSEYIEAACQLWQEDNRGYSFWCTVALLACHRSAFSAEEKTALDRLSDSICERARPIRVGRFFFDVGGYLEALVVLRLLAQEDIAQNFEDATHEWLFFEWGSGAHLGDTRRLLSLLGLLLALDTNPPPQARQLFRRLILLEEQLTTTSVQASQTFRQTIENSAGVLGHLFAKAELIKDLPPVTSPPKSLRIPCFGGAVFRREQTPKGTLETLSRYPFTSSFPDELRCLDAVIVRGKSSGGFCDGIELTPTRPPFQSVTLQQQGEAMALRFYDHRSPESQEVHDGWEYPKDGLGVAWRCLSGHDVMQEKRSSLIWVSTQLTTPGLFVVLWAISLEGPIQSEPIVTSARVIPSVPRRRGEEAWDIDWELPGGLWKVRVDPLAKEPLSLRR